MKRYGELEEKVILPLRTLGSLGRAQMAVYVRMLTGCSPKKAQMKINMLIGENVIAIDAPYGKVLKSTVRSTFSDAVADAFWVYLHMAKDNPGEGMFKAREPSQIIFEKESEIYKITVFHDAEKDIRLMALREGPKSLAINVIAGCDIPLDKVSKEMLPEGRYIYAHIKHRKDHLEKPQIVLTEVNDR